MTLGKEVSRGLSFLLKRYLNERNHDAFEEFLFHPTFKNTDTVSIVSFAYIQLRGCVCVCVCSLALAFGARVLNLWGIKCVKRR